MLSKTARALMRRLLRDATFRASGKDILELTAAGFHLLSEQVRYEGRITYLNEMFREEDRQHFEAMEDQR